MRWLLRMLTRNGAGSGGPPNENSAAIQQVLQTAIDEFCAACEAHKAHRERPQFVTSGPEWWDQMFLDAEKSIQLWKNVDVAFQRLMSLRSNSDNPSKG